MGKKSLFWADQLARKIVDRDNKKKYVCAAGITPSGVVHIGNFREIITVDLVVKALESLGKKVRFIYSWDDFDRLRKVPADVPKSWKKYLGMPVSKVPDPWKCHESYARHFEDEVEKAVKDLWIEPEFIRQSKMYRDCKYSKGIKKAIDNRKEIKKVLDKYRKEPLDQDWYPMTVYCEECWKDTTKIISVDGYKLSYKCKCGNEREIDFREEGIVKLKWRVDWPMRWCYEGVDFEPGGKEHSTPGGSRTTASTIVKKIYGQKPPVYKMYDFITLKEGGGKMSSSKGNVPRISEALEVYTPSLLRYLFARTKPNKEFAISFDQDVLTAYEEFDIYERVHYGKEKEINRKKKAQMSRVYELSQIDHPKSSPSQPSFKHLATMVQIYRSFAKLKKHFKTKTKFDSRRLKSRSQRAKKWVKEHAPERYRFEIQKKPKKVPKNMRPVVRDLIEELKKEQTEDQLYKRFFQICKDRDVSPKKFFKAVYKALIGKSYGPRLAPFVKALGQKKVASILKKAV